MEDTVTGSGEISFGTHFVATRAIVSRSPASRLSYGFFVGIPVVALAIMLATGYNLSRPASLGLPIWAVLLLGPAFVFFFLPCCHALNVWQMRRRNASVGGMLRFAVTDHGFESSSGVCDVKLHWGAIHRVVETKQFFLFYVASTMAHFIPKDCLAAPEDVKRVRAIVHEAVGDKAELQRVSPADAPE